MKKFMKKAILAAAIILAFTTVSCGSKKEEVKKSEPVKQSETQKNEKTKIVIAIPWKDTEINKAIKLFNKDNTEYEAVLKSYYRDSDENNFDEAMKHIQMDIIAGNSPDIIAAEPDKMLTLIKSGYMTDLYPLMESCDGVKKEDFLPNILEALDFDGKLPAVCNTFSIDTVVAKTEFVGENSESWTLDKAIEIYENLPENMDFAAKPYFEKDEFVDVLTRKLGFDSINCKNGSCDFSGDFTKAVKYIDTQGEPKVKNKGEELVYINDCTLAAPVYLTGFSSILAYDIYTQFGGEDITFVGYPSENGCGAITYSSEMMGVLDNSQNKEASWQMINYMFDYRKTSPLGNAYYSFSVLSDQLEIPSKDNDQYSTFALKRPQNPDFSDNPETAIIIDDKTVEKTLNYIKNLEFNFYFDSELNSIIKEELEEMLGGTRTSEQCIDMIENRISIYINERS